METKISNLLSSVSFSGHFVASEMRHLCWLSKFQQLKKLKNFILFAGFTDRILANTLSTFQFLRPWNHFWTDIIWHRLTAGHKKRQNEKFKMFIIYSYSKKKTVRKLCTSAGFHLFLLHIFVNLLRDFLGCCFLLNLLNWQRLITIVCPLITQRVNQETQQRNANPRVQ